jgi:hypothetical protein
MEEVRNGTPGMPCVQATATLTLALPKTGLLTAEARAVVGDVYLADINSLLSMNGLHSIRTTGTEKRIDAEIVASQMLTSSMHQAIE